MVISGKTTPYVRVLGKALSAGTVYSDVASLKCQGGSLDGFVGGTVPLAPASGLSNEEKEDLKDYLMDPVLLQYIRDTTHTSFLDPDSILAQSVHTGGFSSKIPQSRGNNKNPAPFAAPVSMPGYRGRLSVGVLCGYLRECEVKITKLLESCGGDLTSFPLFSLMTKYSCSYARLCRLLQRAKVESGSSDKLLGLFNRRFLQARKNGSVAQERALCDPVGFASGVTANSLHGVEYSLDAGAVVGCKSAFEFSNAVRGAFGVPDRSSESGVRSFSYRVGGSKRDKVLSIPVELAYSIRIWADFQAELRTYFLGPLLDEFPLNLYEVSSASISNNEFSLRMGDQGVSYRVLSYLTSSNGRVEITYESLLQAYDILRGVNYSRLCEVEALLLFLGGMSLFWAWAPFVQKNVAHCANEVERINPIFSPSLKDFGALVSSRGVSVTSSVLNSDVLSGEFRMLAPWVFLPESLVGLRLSIKGSGSSLENLRLSSRVFGSLLKYLRDKAQISPTGLFPYFVSWDSVCLAYHPDYLGEEFVSSDVQAVWDVLRSYLVLDELNGAVLSVESVSELPPSLGVLLPFLGKPALSHLYGLSSKEGCFVSDASSGVSTLYLQLRKDMKCSGQLLLVPTASIMKPKRRTARKGVLGFLSQEQSSFSFEAGRRVVSLWSPVNGVVFGDKGVPVQVGDLLYRFDCFLDRSGVVQFVVRSSYQLGSLYQSDGSARVVFRGGASVLKPDDLPVGVKSVLPKVSLKALKKFPVSETEVSFTAYSPKEAYLWVSSGCISELELPSWFPV